MNNEWDDAYICAYCAGDLKDFKGKSEEGEVLCQECYLTQDSGEYTDWEYLKASEDY